MCSTALCFLLCFIFCSFKAASLCGSVAHWIYCHTSNTSYKPRALGNTFLNVAEYSECLLLNKVCRNNVALLQMLCSDVGHGFSTGKVGEAPKDLEVVKIWEGASLACTSICLHSQASRMPCLAPVRRDLFFFFLKQFCFRKWIFIVAWTCFLQG